MKVTVCSRRHWLLLVSGIYGPTLLLLLLPLCLTGALCLPADDTSGDEVDDVDALVGLCDASTAAPTVLSLSLLQVRPPSLSQADVPRLVFGAQTGREAPSALALVDGLSLRKTTGLGFETRVHGNFSVRSGAPNIVFTHLLKAGGTTIEDMLGSILVAPEDAHAYRRQTLFYSIDAQSLSDSLGKFQEALTPAGSTGSAELKSPDFFRMGNARNPCDYLLSMWAFQSTPYGDPQAKTTGHGKVPHQCLAETLPFGSFTDPEDLYGKDSQAQFSSAEDVKRFRQWVRASAGKKVHYLSYRSYLAAQVDPFEKQLSIPEAATWDDGQWHGCLGKLNTSEESHIADTLAALDLLERYDCIIHTESLQEDMHSCLSKYAERVEDQGIREALQHRIETVTHAKSTSNKGRHGKCEQYFDDDTAGFVWAREGAFASKLGYSKCCGGPS